MNLAVAGGRSGRDLVEATLRDGVLDAVGEPWA
jgi:hypothetical protein